MGCDAVFPDQVRRYFSPTAYLMIEASTATFILKHSIPRILVLINAFSLYRPNAQRLFIKYIYCISPTCIGVISTTIWETFCALT